MEDKGEFQQKEKLGRRGIIKAGAAAGALLLGIGAYKAVERRYVNQEDIYKYENFADLVGRDTQLYPGYFTYFQGIAKIKEGTKLYSKATHWVKDFEKGEARDTRLAEIQDDQEFVVKNPIVITTEADDLVDDNWKLTIEAPINADGKKIGQDKEVDYQATWIGFSIEGTNLPNELLEKVGNQPTGIVFIRLADSSPYIDFWAPGNESKKHILPPENAFIQARPLAIKNNGEWDINTIASREDRQSPWFGPGQTSNGEYIEIGIVSKES